jgi:alpha-D-xyloside xylohydrolase
MKFTDGNWMMQAGVHAHYPAQAYEIEDRGDAFQIYAPTRHIRHRGDTLEGPVLTLDLSSPMPDVIRVTLQHYTGADPAGPEFPLFGDEAEPTTSLTGSHATLTSGRLSASVARGDDWRITFEADGKTVTSSPHRGMALAQVEGEGSYTFGQLTLGVGECVYGLGERFTAFVKNGQVVETWNKDGGTGSDQAYKNVPFYMTNRGYGVFVNHAEEVSFEVASEKVSRVQFSVAGRRLDYFVIYGPTPREILERYTALTGRPALPPAWSFGLWLTTSFTTSYDEETVTSFIQGMENRNLPLHVFHFDCFWMREFHWCDFLWDERVFPDPAAMLQRLKERGLRICVWINPYIAQRSVLFEEGKANGYLIKRADGSVWQTDQWQPGMGIVDFTNPAAARWFAEKLGVLLDMGVDCFKTDFGERIPVDVAYFDGSDPQKMHNFYSYLYNQTVFNLLEEKRGVGEATLFARSATAGCQRFPVHWGGDCYSSFESMAESLRGGLSLGISGFGFWSHDIGGFEGTPPVDVYKRWIAFGLLSSHSRLHGSSSYRVPWVYDEEAVDVLRYFTNLKCRLMPYLFQQAVTARDSGLPVMRAMMVEFPEDRACDYVDRQYLLGDSLLVAPVFSPDGTVDYYVPEGTWTSFLTGKTVQGPGWHTEQHNFTSLPLLVRPNSVVAVGHDSQRPDYDFTQDVTIQVYTLADGATATATIPDLSGTPAKTVTITRNGNEWVAEASGKESAWKLLLVGLSGATTVEGGTQEQTELGTFVKIDSGVTRVTVTLEEA